MENKTFYKIKCTGLFGDFYFVVKCYEASDVIPACRFALGNCSIIGEVKKSTSLFVKGLKEYDGYKDIYCVY